MARSVVDRVAKRLDASDLLQRLTSEISAADLRSLLLGVYEARSGARTPPDVLREYETSRFVAPAALDRRTLARLEQIALAQLPATTQVLELSPLAPLGSCSVLASVHQNKVVSAVRGEVAADPTNVLALECARRRRAAGHACGDAVDLAAIQRVVRAQAFTGPRQVAHFAVLARVSAARDRGELAFETEALSRHLGDYCALAVASSGIDPSRLRATYTPIGARFAGDVADRFDDALRRSVPAGVEVRLDPDRESGRGYYTGVCCKLHVELRSGEVVELGDGGAVDWIGALLSSRKERCVISGIGLERLATLVHETRPEEP